MWSKRGYAAVRVWDLRGLKPERLPDFDGPSRVHRLRFGPEDTIFIISGRAPGELFLCDIAANRRISLGGSTGAWVCGLAFSSDATTLVTASRCGQVKFLRIPTGEELGTLTLDEQVSVVGLTEGEDALITASAEGVIRLWPIAPAEGRP